MFNKLQYHSDLCEKIKKLYADKNADYGDSVQSTYERYGLTSFLVRMEDKLNRIRTLDKKESKVKDEKIEDTLLDLANYALIALVEIENAKKDLVCSAEEYPEKDFEITQRYIDEQGFMHEDNGQRHKPYLPDSESI